MNRTISSHRNVLNCAFFCLGILASVPVAQCAGVFQTSGLLTRARPSATVTALADGKVLIAAGESFAGGGTVPGFTSTAEIYDPVTQVSTATGALRSSRSGHIATLLLTNKVLVTGGSSYNRAEVYDPVTGTWTDTSPFLQPRHDHTATLLPNGKVLLAGGAYSGFLSHAEIYDPQTDTWTATGSLNRARAKHTATLLPNGKVLIVGGSDGAARHAEIYDPATGKWTEARSPTIARRFHTATLLANGKVLLVGAADDLVDARTVELYDPSTGLWSTTGNLAKGRYFHNAILLPNNNVLVTGGLPLRGQRTIDFTEIYNPSTGVWSGGDPLIQARIYHRSCLLPDGRVLIAGGLSKPDTEIYTPTPHDWSAAAPMATRRSGLAATLLNDGKVLVSGGLSNDNPGGLSLKLPTCELFDPPSNSWMPTGAMSLERSEHTAVKLNNGKVLVVGGGTQIAELYDPATGNWNSAGSAPAAEKLTATLLENGRVLVAGGYNGRTPSADSRIYDPTSNSWSETGPLINHRHSHTATLLRDGRVLIVGGMLEAPFGSVVVGSEIYDPATGTWNAAAPPAFPRSRHHARVLPSGKVLLWGGRESSGQYPKISEIYDPSSGVWSATGSPTRFRGTFSSAVLEDGRVMTAGGDEDSFDGPSGSCAAEIYDEPAGGWISTAPLSVPRIGFPMVPLADGRVIAVGGNGLLLESYAAQSSTFNSSAEIYDPILPKLVLSQAGYPIPAGTAKSFGTVFAGAQASLQFTLKNAGTANLTGFGVAIGGPDASTFSISSAPNFQEAAPGEDIIFSVTFSPAAAGTNSASLHLASDQYSFSINLTGLGDGFAPEINVYQPKGELNDGRTARSFGSVKVSKSGATRKFTIKNTGTSNLLNLAIRKEGRQQQDFIIGPLGKTTLPRGASTSFTVTFKPTARGPRNAAIHIRSNDADENPFDIKLTGTGVKP